MKAGTVAQLQFPTEQEEADWEELAAQTFEIAAWGLAYRIGAIGVLMGFLGGITVGMNLPAYLLAWSM